MIKQAVLETIMEADSQPKIEDQIVQSGNMAEERLKATPQDPDSWFDSSNESDSSDSEDEKEGSDTVPSQENREKEQNILEDLSLSVAKEEENKKGGISIAQKDRQFLKYDKYEHDVDRKFSILLNYMKKAGQVNLVELAGLKGRGVVELQPKIAKVIVRAQSRLVANEAIERISDYIDDLNLIRIDIQERQTLKLENFRKIKDIITEKKLYMFGTVSKGMRQLHLGGKAKMAELRKISQELKDYRILSFLLRKIPNRRSYKIIMDAISNSTLAKNEMMKFNKVNLFEVQFKSKSENMRITANTLSKSDTSPYDYEEVFMGLIKKFFVMSFVLSEEKYYEKIGIAEHPDIIFKVIKDKKKKDYGDSNKKHHKSPPYLIVICEREVFCQQSKKIQVELEKVEHLIIGARFFNECKPEFRDYKFDPDRYYVKKFPKYRPYSMIVFARTKEGHTFSWKQLFDIVWRVENGESVESKQEVYLQEE